MYSHMLKLYVYKDIYCRIVCDPKSLQKTYMLFKLKLVK